MDHFDVLDDTSASGLCDLTDFRSHFTSLATTCDQQPCA